MRPIIIHLDSPNLRKMLDVLDCVEAGASDSWIGYSDDNKMWLITVAIMEVK